MESIGQEVNTLCLLICIADLTNFVRRRFFSFFVREPMLSIPFSETSIFIKNVLVFQESCSWRSVVRGKYSLFTNLYRRFDKFCSATSFFVFCEGTNTLHGKLFEPPHDFVKLRDYPIFQEMKPPHYFVKLRD